MYLLNQIQLHLYIAHLIGYSNSLITIYFVAVCNILSSPLHSFSMFPLFFLYSPSHQSSPLLSFFTINTGHFVVKKRLLFRVLNHNSVLYNK